MKNRKLKWANIVGVMVFACALVLNIQTSFDGETSVFGIAVAQETDGSGGEGTRSGSGSDGVDKCPGGSCTWSDSFGNNCSACCPTGKTPECTTFGCTCYQ